MPAYPTPEKVQWFRNEVEIFTSPDYTISFSVGVCTLVIAEVFPEDVGTYRCMITVNGVPNSTSMHLHVAGQYFQVVQLPLWAPGAPPVSPRCLMRAQRAVE